MKREDFLSAIGNPDTIRKEAEAIDAEAQKLWDTIRDAYYTKAGKDRKVQPETWSEEAKTRARSLELRTQASSLRLFAGRLDRVYADPWSHIRSDIIRNYGFLDAASVVDAARLSLAEHGDKDRFVREAEAA